MAPFDVIVVGGGVAGATATHAIAEAAPNRRVLVLERGEIGRGDESLGRASGTAVFCESEGPTTIKMMCSLYATTSKEFLHEHSMEDAKTWFKMTSLGLELQKEKALKLLPSPDKQLKQMGAIMVAPPEHEEALEDEWKILTKAGCVVEKLDEKQVIARTGEASGFSAGLLFPNDAIIDSSAYAKCLLKQAENISTVTIREGSPSVVDISDGSDGSNAAVRLSNGEVIEAENIVVATGAFFHNGPLAGLLKPCYSYLVAMPQTDPTLANGMQYPTSPNLYTYGFSHDWCMIDGVCRMSGEDHFSALKLPYTDQRCKSLAAWTYRRFPQLDRNVPYTGRHGIYSETPDFLPIFSKTTAESSVCYIVGCNAWGQAILSCLGNIVPAVLGYRPYEKDEKEIEALCSIQRFPITCKAVEPSGCKHETVSGAFS